MLPPPSTALAQLVERRLTMREVPGSNHIGDISFSEIKYVLQEIPVDTKGQSDAASRSDDQQFHQY